MSINQLKLVEALDLSATPNATQFYDIGACQTIIVHLLWRRFEMVRSLRCLVKLLSGIIDLILGKQCQQMQVNVKAAHFGWRYFCIFKNNTGLFQGFTLLFKGKKNWNYDFICSKIRSGPLLRFAIFFVAITSKCKETDCLEYNFTTSYQSYFLNDPQ